MITFAIIDDEPGCRRMLASIIKKTRLGEIVLSDEGNAASIHAIIARQPDIVLIDLLMPKIDGLDMIEQLKTAGYRGRFVMISQNDNKELVGEAYQLGVEFFIHKPIHAIEVESVLSYVKRQLQPSLPEMQLALAHVSHATHPHVALQRAARRTLAELGISNEAGAKDFIHAMDYLAETGSEPLSLRTLYKKMALARFSKPIDQEKEAKAIEQRMRRAVGKALTNIASLGLTDYAHPKFEYYAPLFFDFREVRQRMKEIDLDMAHSVVRIHIKKFLFALFDEANESRKGA
ncbi:response regulator [Shouchella rhizosphaerae]|uniref:response regulator n=1 Tax=Shouchella rhizosphaerae TaxID=866786 RepID=UPI003F81115C